MADILRTPFIVARNIVRTPPELALSMGGVLLRQIAPKRPDEEIRVDLIEVPQEAVKGSIAPMYATAPEPANGFNLSLSKRYRRRAVVVEAELEELERMKAENPKLLKSGMREGITLRIGDKLSAAKLPEGVSFGMAKGIAMIAFELTDRDVQVSAAPSLVALASDGDLRTEVIPAETAREGVIFDPNNAAEMLKGGTRLIVR